MWGRCNLLEARPSYSGHLALGCQVGARQAMPIGRTPSYSHLALDMPSLGRLGCQLRGWAHPSTQVVFGLLAWRLGGAGHDQRPRPTWGHLTLESCRWIQGEWVRRQDPRWMGRASGSNYYWVFHQDPRFLSHRILNIIICFKNIIIIKIISKFQRNFLL
jgi:hypothetical protein